MEIKLTSEERQNLCRVAQEAAKSAYVPYSKFRVGAAILGKDKVYIGANVENASYGLSLCAERTEIATAISQGEKEFRAIAVACIDAENTQNIQSMLPCGTCRQWIAELASKAEIIICGTNKIFCLEDLMPLPFSLPKNDKEQ